MTFLGVVSSERGASSLIRERSHIKPPSWYESSLTLPLPIQIATGTAVWYRVSLPVVPLRWVLIREPQRRPFRTQALLCTDLSVPPVQVMQWFILRWQLETTYAEVRARLRIEPNGYGP